MLNYQAVIVDEAQDMSAEAFRLIRQIIPPGRASHANDLFIVGDAHQRIYAHKVVLGQCGIDIRGRSRRLKLNYRTTEEIGRWATALLHGLAIDDLDGSADDARGYRALCHGEPPHVRVAKTFEDEVATIADAIRAYRDDGITESGICLVCRTVAQVEQYESALVARGYAFRRLTSSASDDASATGLRSATMHRVKGLEFDVVIAAGLTHDALPLHAVAEEIDSPHAREAFETRERSLLYVAVTRARRHALVTAYGKPSFLLDPRGKGPGE
jgi:superfamily I DNA/RNA helicase